MSINGDPNGEQPPPLQPPNGPQPAWSSGPTAPLGASWDGSQAPYGQNPYEQNPYGQPGPTQPQPQFGAPTFGQQAQFGAPTQPQPQFGDPTQYGPQSPYEAQNPYGYPSPYDNPAYYPYQQAPAQPPKSNVGRNTAIGLGALAVVGVLVAVLLVTTDHGSHGSANAQGSPSPGASGLALGNVTGSASPSGSATPSATDTSAAGDTGGIGGDVTTSANSFDPSELNDASTDPAPFTTDALMPQTFTDSKQIEYSLQAGGVENCIQKSMSSKVQSTLRQNGCSQELTASYTVDSSTVTSTDDILVSVQVFAFKDEATAKAVYADFPSSESWDFGIWCPKSGDGANPCSADADYQDAYKSEWIGQDYRYLIEATALYTDMSQSSSVKDWTDAAAKEAVNDAGPAYYISSQD
jgi:hypothetical protein